MEQTSKFYAVKAKCGHVGRNNYLPITFGIKAYSGKEAAEKVRYMPRVKHHHKDAILSVREINYEEFLAIIQMNNEDSYLKVTSKQDQNLYCLDLDDRLIKEHKYHKSKRNREEKLTFLKLKEISLMHESRRERLCY